MDAVVAYGQALVDAPARFADVEALGGTPPACRTGRQRPSTIWRKRVKRVAFGIVNHRNYRIRTLLYAGKPNWDLLDTINPAQS